MQINSQLKINLTSIEVSKAGISLFLNYELFWMKDTMIIEFAFRTIWGIIEILEGVICQDRLLLDLHNSSDDTQPHPINY